MDFFSSMRVSASGLEAQMKRMNTVSSNLANADTTRGADGGPYKRKDAVLAATTDRESFGEILQNELDENIQGVQVQAIHEDERPPRLVYNPSHPDANDEGYVAMPNVNPVEETANMISVQRSYEANVTAMNAAKAMANKALQIGK
ncbi:MAG TPA: flagellar basal body rod protein FlgC [Bdellovibrionales bacterium]|nr:MAG: flagellar basal body rod protein FlgC [Bdellovibrionales bacterium GWB1_52_6]OFZ04786.1 MAG: flagellar basal body rod protein FlgC [Bdellovibrionales bacterium GWA1_52_35]HAR43349.1 flagellar basal body rod protein FlgC [Bdellovibrionales bacterium]HCM39603.1 flagellar basal body rod protein FlgC [Bdellovibrionales bacterium]